MSLVLKIENMTTLPDGGPLTYVLSSTQGADIGRDAHLDWTLPDATRHISGRHCEIRFEVGGYWLRDVSANGTFLNGSEHRVQSPYRLKTGDRITIGDYIIAVEVTGESQPQASVPIRQVPVFGEDQWSVEGAAPPADPRDFRPKAASAPVRPDFLEWAVDVPDAPGVGFVARSAAPTPASRLPREAVMDWDVEPAVDPVAPPAPMPAPPPAVPTPRRSIWVSPGPSGPWGGEEEAVPADQPADPEPPVPRERAPLPPAAAPAPAAFAPAPVPPAPARPVAPAPVATRATGDLLARFAKGAGLGPNALAPEEDAGAFLERLGALLLGITGNVKQLLDARSQTKRIAGSSRQTMIQALDNNPLKFSPTGADALRTMLGPRSSGYLDADEAFREGFDDLKTHQVKLVSAMQHALQRLLDDIDPKAIEASMGETKGPGAWLGMRRAQLWTAYEARWRTKTSRHGGGLQDVFMQYFAECYDQLPAPDKPGQQR